MQQDSAPPEKQSVKKKQPPERKTPKTAAEKSLEAKPIGSKVHVPARAPGGSWVQTERASHEAWARLCANKPLASAVLHVLVARMGTRNAVVVSQKTLAKILGVTDRSIRSAVAVLVENRWVQMVHLNGPGTVAAYVVNASVAWSQKRENLHLASFSATVIADAEDQIQGISHRELRKIPMIYVDERQLPTGPGGELPNNSIADLPSLKMDDPDDF